MRRPRRLGVRRPALGLLAVATATPVVVASASVGPAGSAARAGAPPSGTERPTLASSLVPPGERWLDVRADDAERRAFLAEARRTFNIPPSVALGPVELARICVDDATARLSHVARQDDAYARRPERIRRDVEEVNRLCHERYGDEPYVASSPPAGSSGGHSASH